MRRDEARQLIEEAVVRWRGDATRLTERAGQGLQGIFAQLGLVGRDEVEELELRLAQVEHRLRLVEGAAEPGRRRPCKTEGVASGTKTRNLGRMSEIAQVAVKHGFGYFFSRNKLTDLLPGAGDLARRRRGVRARSAPARDARRARADVREVRPAPVHEAGRRAAGHRRRAAKAPGRRQPVPVLPGRAGDRGGAGPADRAALRRVRRAADRRRVHRPGARGRSPQRPPRRREGAAPDSAEADRGRPRAALPGGEDREGPRPRARLHRRAEPRGRVRAAPCARSSTTARRRATPTHSTGTSPVIRTCASRASTGATRARACSRSSSWTGRRSPSCSRASSRTTSAGGSRTRWRRPG